MCIRDRWTVEDGVLLARQDPKGRRDGESWLITEKDFTDFLLAVKFRVTAGGNSGVFLRDPLTRADRMAAPDGGNPGPWESGFEANINAVDPEYPCLLYTSDAADERSSVDLGGRRIIKKKINK